MALTTTMSRVKARTDALKLSLKLPARNIALIANISPAVFSNGLLGTTYLGAETEMRLAEITLKLQELEDAVSPLALPTDAERLRLILNYVNENKIQSDNIRAAVQSLFGVAENFPAPIRCSGSSHFRSRANPESAEEFNDSRIP
jgi:hypothetical protein